MQKEQLSPSQSLAVTHGSGPLLVLAGPGSGKTFTLVRRVYHLITQNKIQPEHILVLTFTKAAAAQMKDRFLRLSGGAYERVTFGTFHAVYYHILKDHPNYQNCRMPSAREKEAVITEILERHGWQNAGEERSFSKSEIEQLSEACRQAKHRVLSGFPFESAPPRENGAGQRKEKPQAEPESPAGLTWQQFAEFWEEYREMASFRHWLEYDDMILECLRLLREDASVLQSWQQQFTHLLVDEFQDISPQQYQVLRLLAAPQDNLFVVGDDDQSIYGFRGADPSCMRRFLADYSKAGTVALQENYRSSRAIVKAAAQVIEKNQDRMPKAQKARGKEAGPVVVRQFGEKKEQAAWLVQEFSDASRRDRKESRTTALLVRTNRQAAGWADILCRAAVPFRMLEPARCLYDHFVARDLFAYLRFAKAGRARKDFLQIMNRPVRYLTRESLPEPAVDLERLRQYYADKGYMRQILRKLQWDMARLSRLPLPEAVEYLLKQVGYEKYLRDTLPADEAREAWEVVQSLREAASCFPDLAAWESYGDSLRDAMAKGRSLLNDPQAGKRRLGEDGSLTQIREDPVDILTLHGCKGLEFDRVYLPDVNEGILPYRKAVTGAALEEERRLFYVGMTRAKEKLVITCIKKEQDPHGVPSRFLQGITGSVRER